MKRLIPLLLICGTLLFGAGLFVSRALFGPAKSAAPPPPPSMEEVARQNTPAAVPASTGGGNSSKATALPKSETVLTGEDRINLNDLILTPDKLPPRLQVALQARDAKYLEIKTRLYQGSMELAQALNNLDAEIQTYDVNREVNQRRMVVNQNLAAMGAQTLPLNTQIVNFQGHAGIIKSAAMRFQGAFAQYQADKVAIEAEFFAKYAEVYGSRPNLDAFEAPETPEIDEELMFMIIAHDHLDEVFTQMTGMTPGWRTIVQEIIAAEANAEGGK